MSMNLNAEYNNGEIELYQTPTQISYTICVDENGDIKKLKGKKARRALQAYCQWAEYLSNGVWENAKDYQEKALEIQEHIRYVKSFLNEKSLTVYVN